MTIDRDLWALWPDGFMCPIGEVDEYLTPPCAYSDDFERVIVTSYGEDGAPYTWLTSRQSGV